MNKKYYQLILLQPARYAVDALARGMKENDTKVLHDGIIRCHKALNDLKQLDITKFDDISKSTVKHHHPLVLGWLKELIRLTSQHLQQCVK